MINDLRWARRRVAEWPLEEATWRTLEAGVRRVDRRGRAGLVHSLDQPDDAVFHDWRKWAKDQRYHTQLLRDTWPALVTPLADQLGELGDLLGQDHDLTVLRQTVLQDMTRPIRASTLQALLGQPPPAPAGPPRARPAVGRRVYVEPPAAFAHRVRGYWHAWRPEPALGTPAPAVPAVTGATVPEPVVDYACDTGEGPLWHPLEQRLYWVDIPRGRLFRYDPAGVPTRSASARRTPSAASRSRGTAACCCSWPEARSGPGGPASSST